MAVREYRYEYMFPGDFSKAISEMPVFIVPTGLLEWHGNHLPLGLDSLKIHGICLEAARKLGGGVVLPPIYFGRPGYSTYIGTLTYSEGTVYNLWYETMEQLKKADGKVIAIIAGHYGECQVELLKRVAADFAAKNKDVRVIAKPENEGVLLDGAPFGDHAGKCETSILWALYPQHIRWETYDTRISGMKIYENAPHDYYKESPAWDFGEDLRETSSIELGNKLIDAISDVIAAEIRQALEA